MEYFHNELGIATSLNVYHTYLGPGEDDKKLSQFIPSKKEVAKVYKNYTSFMDMKNSINNKYTTHEKITCYYSVMHAWF